MSKLISLASTGNYCSVSLRTFCVLANVDFLKAVAVLVHKELRGFALSIKTLGT